MGISVARSLPYSALMPRWISLGSSPAADPALTSLATLTDACAMSRVLRTALTCCEDGAVLSGVAIDVLRYKPERKCVLRYDLEWSGGDSLPWLVYAKAVPRSELGRASEMLAALRASPAVRGFDLPEPLGVLSELGAELYSHVPGSALSTFCEASDFAPMCRRVGRALRELQAAHVAAAPRPGTDAQLECLERAAAELSLLLPSARVEIERLWYDLGARLAAAAVGPLSIVHGDFHGDSVLVHAGGLGLVDLEDCAWDVPQKDVGSMWAHLLWLSLKGGRPPQPLEQARRAFLEGYFEDSGGGDRETAAVQAAFHCFLYACEHLRRYCAAGEESQARALLAAGQDILARGLP